VEFIGNGVGSVDWNRQQQVCQILAGTGQLSMHIISGHEDGKASAVASRDSPVSV